MRLFGRRLVGFGLLLPVLWGALALASRAQEAGPPYDPGRISLPIKEVRFDWLDEKRSRQVPVKIYFPGEGPGPFPVVLFSHGLGGSREGYGYLGRHWAGQGYVSVHLQHLGSDQAVWQESWLKLPAMKRAAAKPMNAINRPLDVSFALNELERLNREEGPFQGRLDLARVGAAGHSFGAFTTLAVAGQVFFGKEGRPAALADARIKAAIPMSAPAPRQKERLAEAYGQISIPCLHMTGTKDKSPIGATSAAERRLPYDHITGADQYLIIFTGGDHMIFSDHKRRWGDGTKDARFHDLIRLSGTAFWDAYLKGDARAKDWLAGDGFVRALGPDGTFEKKVKPLQKSGN